MFEHREGIIEQDNNKILHLEINLNAVVLQMPYAERIDINTIENILDYNSAYGMVIREIQRIYEKEYR